jgi:hypothetical protein
VVVVVVVVVGDRRVELAYAKHQRSLYLVSFRKAPTFALLGQLSLFTTNFRSRGHISWLPWK